jgi:hypothetical protein
MTDPEHPGGSHSHIYSLSDDNSTVLLPPPGFGIPAYRPYTSATVASARTYVDLDAEMPVPGTSHHNHSQVSSRSHGQQSDAEFEPEPSPPQMPQTSLTFLLVSGRRRTMSFEPDTTVGRVKELVWNAWPSGEYTSWLSCDVPRVLGRCPI